MTTIGRKNCDPRLLAFLATGMTIEAAAKEAGVSERTAHRRMADRRFRNELAKLKDQIVAAAVTRLSNSSTAAVDALVELLKAKSETARLGAARTILELGVSMKENVELAARITELERRQNESDKASNPRPSDGSGRNSQSATGPTPAAG